MKIITFSALEIWKTELIISISACAETAIKQYGSFHIVLSGGDTPSLIYPELAKLDTSWDKWHFWIGDERFPSENFSQLNKLIIQDLLLNKIRYLTNQVHFKKVELGYDKAISDYSKALMKVKMFDLALLGIGVDGHTASLFPGNNIGIGEHAEDLIRITNAPKYPPDRLSLSAKRLSASRNVLFIARGVEKKSIISKIQEDDSLPCNKIHGANESRLYYCSE